MLVQLNLKSGKPVYLQVVDQIKLAVASGALRQGETLPSIRPLAERLRISRNTVAKAYTELESQGVIETAAGKGCFVKSDNSPLRTQVRREMAAREIDAAIVHAHHLQVSDADFMKLVEERLRRFARKRADQATPTDPK